MTPPIAMLTPIPSHVDELELVQHLMPAVSTMLFDAVGCHTMLTALRIIMGIEHLVALDDLPPAHAGRPFSTCKVTAKQEQKQGKKRVFCQIRARLHEKADREAGAQLRSGERV